MFIRKSTLLASGTAVLGLALATSGYAASSALTRLNHLTFSGPVSLPGVTLERGTYTFERISMHPDIVRVLSRDGSRVYFTGFTTQVTRPVGLPADRIVTMTETRRGTPPRLDTWYPIGTSIGLQFIYPDAVR